MDYLYNKKRKINNEWQYVSVMYNDAYYSNRSAYDKCADWADCIEALDHQSWVIGDSTANPSFMELPNGSDGNKATKADVMLTIKTGDKLIANNVSLELQNVTINGFVSTYNAKILALVDEPFSFADWLVVNAIFILHD